MGKKKRGKRDGTGSYSKSYRALKGLKGERGGVCKTKTIKKRKTKKR